MSESSNIRAVFLDEISTAHGRAAPDFTGPDQPAIAGGRPGNGAGVTSGTT